MTEATMLPRHLFQTVHGDDWYIAHDATDALSLHAELVGEAYASDEGMEPIGDDKPFGMLWRREDVPAAVEGHPDTRIEMLDGPCGDGWTCRVVAPARVWAAHFDRGLLASVNF